jgi:hypothetical protein
VGCLDSTQSDFMGDPRLKLCNAGTGDRGDLDKLLSVLQTAKSKSMRDWAMILTTYSHGLESRGNMPIEDWRSGYAW